MNYRAGKADMHVGIEFTQQYITGRLRCKTASACSGEETDTGGYRAHGYAERQSRPGLR